MKAVTYHGEEDFRVDNVDDPEIQDSKDAIIKVTSTAICGSDLHIYGGLAPAMQEGDVIGHEFMGEVVEKGDDVDNLSKGDRVVVPFTISCGHCWYCNHEKYSLCDNSNPNAEQAKENLGHTLAGLFGYSHMMGGFNGGQAEYVRVPYANVGPVKVPDSLEDEQVLFLSDIFPTGYMAAENAEIEAGDTVAVWGCGPVGQFCIQSAWMLGAGRVIAVDMIEERLDMAENHSKAEVIRTIDEDEVYEQLMEMTDGAGPDSCIDAVGAEAHGTEGFDTDLDESQPDSLAQIFKCCRKGGNVSIPGVYLGTVKELPFGMAMNKGLTLKTGQTHMQKYMKPLLTKVEAGDIDPSFIITHRMDLDDAPQAYEKFRNKEDGCVKVVLSP